MQPWVIVLIVLGSIVALYLFLLVMDIIFVLIFKNIFVKHNQALSVCLQAKYDDIDKFINLLKKYNVSIDKRDIDKFNSIDTSCFKNQESHECKVAREYLTTIRDNMVFRVSQDEILSKHVDINKLLSYIKELDANYRTLIAMYNADVLGYNYWINFLPTRVFYKKVFKVKEKQIIA